MTRPAAIEKAQSVLASGGFREGLARRVAIRTVSKNADVEALNKYLHEELIAPLEAMGFSCRLLTHAAAPAPFLYAERIESAEAVTVLGYGHIDVVPGLDAGWDAGLSPWTLTERDGRWYGRGAADSKGQHSINLAAMASVLEARGALGFNAKWLFECGEELGSPGLRAFVEDNAALLAADILIASDGPRLAIDKPTIFLGARGLLNLDLTVEARRSGYHSGNWGGLLSNPGIILAHAIAAIVGPTGQIRIPELKPAAIPPAVRAALRDCAVEETPDGPKIDAWWGEPGLSAAEKIYGWSSFETLAFECGDPKAPVNAIPPRAWARCQLRFTVDVDPAKVIGAIRARLDREDLGMVSVALAPDEIMRPTRLDPDDAWVRFAAQSMEQSMGARPAVLPNIGGSLPNDIFVEVLNLPTVWVPHSYPGCLQHAPNEHIPISIVREGLTIMAGLFWDLGQPPARASRDAHRAP
jgi:acetylornithine deacetylase/succinyl-diaminopimelate desuccinylase-like protein